MPQSFAAVYVHIVFSTKHRTPAIRSDWSERLYQYIGGIVANGRGELLAVGGMPDHVHLLVSLGRDWSLANLLREAKAGSSKWVHDHFPNDVEFSWQNGYGAFSVSKSNLPAVKQYIADQEKHHLTMSFQDELRELLRRHGIEWDERYIWD
jgi:REP element-mobilizing transposase RayT